VAANQCFLAQRTAVDAIYRANQRGESTYVARKRAEVAREVAARKLKGEAGRASLLKTREDVSAGWRRLGAILDADGDHKLADAVRSFESRNAPRLDREGVDCEGNLGKGSRAEGQLQRASNSIVTLYRKTTRSGSSRIALDSPGHQWTICESNGELGINQADHAIMVFFGPKDGRCAVIRLNSGMGVDVLARLCDILVNAIHPGFRDTQHAMRRIVIGDHQGNFFGWSQPREEAQLIVVQETLHE
jgi:hypothetical protein